MVSSMRRGLAALWMAAAVGLSAQDAVPGGNPSTTLTASYSFATQDGSDGWVTSQAAALGFTGRWGSAFTLEGQLRAPFDGSPVTADALLQQLTLTWNPSAWGVVTFGKQRLKWGTARVFAAVDGLEPSFDPLHPRSVLDGVTGVKVEVLPTDWLSVSALVLPAPILKNTKQALRLDVLWGEADLSAGAIHHVVDETNRTTFYADYAQFFERFGFYAEAEAKSFRSTWGVEDADGLWTPKATVGTQIEFPVWLNGTLRWLTEYHYNGDGFTKTEASRFAQAWKTRFDTGSSFVFPQGLSVATFSRHYGYTGLSGLPVTQKLSVGASVLTGLDTGFVLARAEAWYSVDQSLSVGLDYSRFDHWPGLPRRVSEDLLVDQTNQISLTVSGSY